MHFNSNQYFKICRYIVRKFCEADTCENNGKCIEHAHGFRCVCPQGYKGKLCDGRYKCVAYKDMEQNSSLFDVDLLYRKPISIV